MLESHDDVEFDGHRPHEVNPSDIVLNRKKRQQQMTNFDFFHHCLQNIGKSGIEFQDYLFCKYTSGITFPEVAELQPLDSTPIQKNKVTRLEADDDDAETVTTFDEYLREKEKKAKDRLKHPKNPKGFVNDEGEDDDGDD